MKPPAPRIDLDEIYETALLPHLWPDIAGRIAESHGCMGGLLFASNAIETRWVASPRLETLMHEFVKGGWGQRNSRMPRMMALRRAGFVTEPDVYTEEELAADPLFTEFLWPRNIGRGAGTLINLPTGDSLVFHVERWRDAPAFDAADLEGLDALRPHLARAALVTVRLQQEKARAAVDTLESLGLPAAVVTAQGRVVAINDALAGSPQIGSAPGERLRLRDTVVGAELAEALDRVARGRLGGSRSLAVPASEATSAAVLHVVPLRLSSREVFTSGEALLVLTELSTTAPPPGADLLGALFDLTPAEARLAGLIAAGSSLAEIAEEHDRSIHTLRGQLKAIMTKTGVNRQSDLVRLLGGIRIER